MDRIRRSRYGPKMRHAATADKLRMEQLRSTHSRENRTCPAFRPRENRTCPAFRPDHEMTDQLVGVSGRNLRTEPLHSLAVGKALIADWHIDPREAFFDSGDLGLDPAWIAGNLSRRDRDSYRLQVELICPCSPVATILGS